MGRSSLRGRLGAALVAAAIVCAAAPASAHRRDEYLQAARIAIDPGRVEIQLDLTPGIAVAAAVLADIDRDGESVYAARVMGEVRLEVDGRPAHLLLIERRFPSREAAFGGEGSIQLRFAAPTPDMGAGAHRLVFRNDHRPEIGMYLANALAPADPRVSIGSQRRDVPQRELTIDYTLGGAAPLRVPWWLAAGVVIGIATLADRFVRRKSFTGN
jgi:hypothetical protein